MIELSDVATIGRIAAIEDSVAAFRAAAYRAAGIPLPQSRKRFGRLVELASIAFNITPAELTGRSQVRRFVYARWAVMWVATKALGMASTEIGRLLGQKDHSTVLYGIGRCGELRQEDASYRAITDELLAIASPETERFDGPATPPTEPAREEAEHAPSSR